MADIAYKRDIDRIVAKELGFSEKKVKANSDFLVRRLKQIMADPEIDHIVLTHLGTMYTKIYIIDKKVERAKRFGDEIKTIWSRKIERYKEIFQGVPYKKFMKYHGRFRILKWSFTKGRKFKELQAFQNGED